MRVRLAVREPVELVLFRDDLKGVTPALVVDQLRREGGQLGERCGRAAPGLRAAALLLGVWRLLSQHLEAAVRGMLPGFSVLPCDEQVALGRVTQLLQRGPEGGVVHGCAPMSQTVEYVSPGKSPLRSLTVWKADEAHTNRYKSGSVLQPKIHSAT